MRVDNSTLFLVQGTGQALNFPGMAWGNGFVTDKPTVSALSTPSSWRDHLVHERLLFTPLFERFFLSSKRCSERGCDTILRDAACAAADRGVQHLGCERVLRQHHGHAQPGGAHHPGAARLRPQCHCATPYPMLSSR